MIVMNLLMVYLVIEQVIFQVTLLWCELKLIWYFDNNNVMDYINRLIDYLYINNYMALSNEAT